jgi:hypothetical protein
MPGTFINHCLAPGKAYMPIARIVMIIFFCVTCSGTLNAKPEGEIDSEEGPPEHECDYLPTKSIL